MRDLEHAIYQLHTAQNQIRQKWLATRALWRDSVAERFEVQYWLPLEQESRRTAKEMERVAEVITSARRHVR